MEVEEVLFETRFRRATVRSRGQNPQHPLDPLNVLFGGEAAAFADAITVGFGDDAEMIVHTGESYLGYW